MTAAIENKIEEQRETRAIAEAINGFAELYPRQQTRFRWTVLSTRNDSVTAHSVHTRDMTCTCEDAKYNAEGNEICDHLAVALFQSTGNISHEDMSRWTMSTLLADGRKAVDQLQGMAQNSSEPPKTETVDEPEEDTPTKQQADESSIEYWLRAGDKEAAFGVWMNQQIPGFDADEMLEYWEHEDFGSINFKADGMPDEQFDAFTKLCSEADEIMYDRNGNVNFVKASDLEGLIT